MIMYTDGIGFIDSGVGGFTLVKEAMKQLPNEQFYYLGDTARSPYGPKDMATVKAYAFELANYLVKNHQIKILVIACNTATVAALKDLKQALPIPVLGVILPGCRAAIKASVNHQIGVIATHGTIQSGRYELELKRKRPDIEVTSLACPEFAPMVEAGDYRSVQASSVVRTSLQALEDQDLDTLILGCTHYPIIKDLIQDSIGPGISLVDPGAEAVNDLSVLLDYYDLTNDRFNPNLTHHFYTTGDKARFKKIADDWLDHHNYRVDHLDLEELQEVNGR